MNENDTKAACAAVRFGVEKMIASERTRMVSPDEEALVAAAMSLAEGFIVNVARIADALEQIAENTK